jgi:hypothetical protein
MISFGRVRQETDNKRELPLAAVIVTFFAGSRCFERSHKSKKAVAYRFGMANWTKNSLVKLLIAFVDNLYRLVSQFC